VRPAERPSVDRAHLLAARRVAGGAPRRALAHVGPGPGARRRTPAHGIHRARRPRWRGVERALLRRAPEVARRPRQRARDDGGAMSEAPPAAGLRRTMIHATLANLAELNRALAGSPH